jgi:integrase
VVKLSARNIDTFKVIGRNAETIYYDGEIPGFGIRIRKGGSRNFVYSYRFGGKNRRLTLGTAAKEAFPDIRRKVLELQAQVRLGRNPAGERDVSRAAAADTFKAIIARYLVELPKKVKKNKQRIRANTVSEIERYLLVVAESLHAKPITTITKRDIADLLSTTATKRGAVTANRLRSALSTAFVWAMGEGVVETNPTVDTNVRGEVARDRTLVNPKTGNMDELTEVWRALDDSPFADIVRMLVLTGMRRTEVGGLRWSEIDDDLTLITIPKHRSKNGVEHLVPLTAAAREVLARQPRIAGHDCIFSARSNIGFSGWDERKKELDAKLLEDRTALKMAPMALWTLHDLRRSVATGLAECCKVQPHVVEAVLNHQSGSRAGVAGTYNKAMYLKEKTEALAMWAEHLAAAVDGTAAKVVPLRAKA